MGSLAHNAPETGSLQHALFKRNLQSQKSAQKNKSLTKKELEPFVKDLTAKQPFNSERIGVTDPNAFLDSILPYMLKQKMIKEIREDKKVVYQLNK